MKPAGGHAVYIDARRFLPQIPALQYPGQSLAVQLYIHGGVRGCEIGTAMFGMRPDGTEVPATMDLVRLAIPRRTYTKSQMDYVVEVVQEVHAEREQMRGMKFVRQPPVLRHFTGRFGYVD
jgi:tryptophanase